MANTASTIVHVKPQIIGVPVDGPQDIVAASPPPEIPDPVPVPRRQRRGDQKPGTDRHAIRQCQGREREELTAGTSQKRAVRARPKRTRRLGRGRGRGGSEGDCLARGVLKESPGVERVVSPEVGAGIQVVEPGIRSADAGPAGRPRVGRTGRTCPGSRPAGEKSL